jgi:hypothetical protein
MIVAPRRGFEAPVRIADAINPFIVLLSIVGLFLEYSPIKATVLPFNKALDIIFVADFIVRLACHRPLRYLAKGYGWVDLLASLPGFMLLFAYTPLFAIFKLVRIGRFFKIIRVLRFLRVFNFLKKMKSESPWIQDRVMKVGVSIVLCFVVGISLADLGSKAALEATRAEAWKSEWSAARGDLTRLAAGSPGLFALREGESFRDSAGVPRSDGRAAWEAALSDEARWAMEVPLQAGSSDALLVFADDLMPRHDQLMVLLLSTLVALLLVVIFYLGAVFAQDMAGVHLIIDSIEAEDLQLLRQEALRAGGGSLSLVPGESELESLLKAVARLGVERVGADGSGEADALQGLDIEGLGLPGLGPSSAAAPAVPAATGRDGVEDRLDELDLRLERIESAIAGSNKRLVVETVRIITPAIVRAIRKADRESS